MELPPSLPSSTPTTKISGSLISAIAKQVSFPGSYLCIFLSARTLCHFNHEICCRCLFFIYVVIGCILIFYFIFTTLPGAFLSLFFCLVLVSPGQDAKDWDIEVLTVIHNGDNDAELARVRKNHPGEPECIVDRRVLGALAPTRCESCSSIFYFRFHLQVSILTFVFSPHIPLLLSPLCTSRHIQASETSPSSNLLFLLGVFCITYFLDSIILHHGRSFWCET
jgi:hypothetical protein